MARIYQPRAYILLGPVYGGSQSARAYIDPSIDKAISRYSRRSSKTLGICQETQQLESKGSEPRPITRRSSSEEISFP